MFVPKMINPDRLPCSQCDQVAEYSFSDLLAAHTVTFYCKKHAAEKYPTIEVA